ncbi:MAG: sulfotransferase [Actinomycetota bacterium]|nr:sulfotransferase [Actinomycetota bacterium]
MTSGGDSARAPRPDTGLAQAELVLPRFLIVGAMRGGTSALAYCLQEHPQIFMPEQEVNFFTNARAYAAGPAEYARRFAGHGGEPLVGEKSPAYSAHPDVPERIARLLPDARLVWILRNPVDRAYSHHRLFVQTGKERRPFEEAVTAEREDAPADWTVAYLGRGVYADQIQRYLQFFPRSQMASLLSEDFRARPAEALGSLCRFLDVDDGFTFTRFGVERNSARVPRSVGVQWAAYHLLVRMRLPKRVRQPLYRAVRRVNTRRGVGTPPLDEGLRAQLLEFFEPHNRELAALTGLDLSAWER